MATAEVVPFDYRVRDRLLLAADGRIIDFLDETVHRPNEPEERVRQGYTRTLVYQYGYPKGRIVLGAPINIGSELKFADIVIYRDEAAAKRKDQAAIQIVVETKAPTIKKGIRQLQSYIFASSAEGGVWINQTDAPQYFRRGQPNTLDQWPGIPRNDEGWDDIGQHTKKALRPPHNLVETFKRCHNALYKVGIDSEDLAMDMVRIILAKYQDETQEGDQPEFRVSPIELNNAEGRKKVGERVRKLFAKVRDLHPDVFGPHETITAGDREIATVVAELQEFQFISSPESAEVFDVVGAAYEVYVGSHLKGDRGQYFTHRLIVGLLVRMVDPAETDIIFDPAMGSGGFLIAAMRQIQHRINASNRSSAAKAKAEADAYRRLFGIDKSPKLVKVARTNMILASDGHAGLIHADTLDPPSTLPTDFKQKAGPEVPTVILTNPPFGATSEHRIMPDREPEVLEQFEVAHVWRKYGGVLRPTKDLITEGVPPEYLFVERVIRWVKPGGKIGIVVPRGLLDNDKALNVRTFITQHTRILAVVNCHDDTFKPHTDAKAALLVLERKMSQSALEEDDYPIFMAISQGIGHNGVGQPVYKTDAKGDVIRQDGEPVLDQDTDDIFEAWQLLGRGEKSPSEYYYTVPRSQITANLNLNPIRYLPRYAASRQAVLEIGERPGWTVERLGQVATVYNGHRFKRPYADKGVTSGPGIVRFFTGNAITQTRAENTKYFDLAKAKPIQLKMLKNLYLERGMILITDSGTVGRVVVATGYHEGAIGTNNLIRVVTPDNALQGYLYQFLISELGQHQLKANIYGAIVDHIEPDDVKNVLVPVPTDRATLERIGLPVNKSIEHQEAYQSSISESEIAFREAIESAELPEPTATPETSQEYKNFENLTKALLTVPKSEITDNGNDED